ncbi:hypothetical protein GGR56DRAFT_696770 [Xylariaceae sp. FL0804]|nr:hypothetical protein GGR56DRAFT_696770 [Xylariaceae sp. FL0804]
MAHADTRKPSNQKESIGFIARELAGLSTRLQDVLQDRAAEADKSSGRGYVMDETRVSPQSEESEYNVLSVGDSPITDQNSDVVECGQRDGVEKDARLPNESQAIAVVGMSCRFPGDATNLEGLWDTCSKAREAWSEWPKDRFNQDGFHHPSPERGGNFNAGGGHFLKQGMGEFDAPFFNITPTEAKALDPQQRLQLESAYEALENAGITLERVSGSKTGVFIGTSNHDYEHMLWKDPESLPLYHAVGVSASIMANRISYFFNLRGPSVTTDTACSSTLVALHQACQSLRMGESTHAIVGGANLILEPGMLIPMSSLKFFSPDGKCYTYDHRASGYGRGEGVGTVILKPFDDAIRDGDTIRCVIRATGANSDGRTAGLMLPSGDAQEALIRSTYEAAQLDPALTRYVEGHGTGTSAGDPIESGALGRVFGAASAAAGAPSVRVGSVKTNIGHLENASGIAGLIKTILSVERGMILPNSNFEKPGDRVLLAEQHLEVPTSLQPWPVEGLRRASINSFGFGGTNAHCIIDDAENYMKLRGIAGHVSPILPRNEMPRMTEESTQESSVTLATPQVFVLSANDAHTMKKLSKSLASHFTGSEAGRSRDYVKQLAYTLHERRSLLPFRAAIVASDPQELASKLANEDIAPRRTSQPPKLGFVFTGQGAQYSGMGRELSAAYPVFRETIATADDHLKSLGCTWSLREVLSTDDDSNQLRLASVSQPVCTAVQLGIVDLLASWDVRPTAVVGHSSGEIAAAYAAGALTLKSAMAVAFHRGQAVANLKRVAPELRGAMLAAGVSPAQARRLVAQVKAGELAIACVNSPSSVTLSGDEDAVDQAARLLDDQKLFARRLEVDVAYHSQHMLFAANDYMSELLKGPSIPDGAPRQSRVTFASSVEARVADLGELGASYWVRNMVSPVLFSDALAKMITGKQGDGIDALLEVGPHSTLARPIQQTLATLTLDREIRYLPTLLRGQNAHESLLKTAGGLWKSAYPVDINKANGLENPLTKFGPLPSLPPYPFNHTVNHWHESRLSRAYRFRKEGRHDLLGAIVPASTAIEPQWRNVLRVTEVPWLKDHIVQSTVVYPAAGYIAMAIEAARQRHLMGRTSEVQIKGFQLRNISLTAALVIPKGDAGVETSLSLRPVAERDRESSTTWTEFRIFSYAEGQEWTEHCRGQIAIDEVLSQPEVEDEEDDEREQEETYWRDTIDSEFKDCEKGLPDKELYDTFEALGLQFGPTFRNLRNVTVGQRCNSRSEIEAPDTAATMPQNTEFFNTIHPALLDSCFQAAFPALVQSGRLKDPMVPTFIEELSIQASIPKQPGATLSAYASTKPFVLRDAVSDITVFGEKDSGGSGPAVSVRGLKTTSLSWGSNQKEADQSRKICYSMRWVADMDLISTQELSKLWPAPDKSAQQHAAESLAILEWLAFQYISESLSELTGADLAHMSKHHKQLYEWCQRQTLPSTGVETEGGDAVLPTAHAILSQPDSPAKKQAAIEFTRSLGAEGEIVRRIGESLVLILRGAADPLGLMVQDGLLGDVYSQDPSMLRCYELLRAFAADLARQHPNMDVLEIGAGTGGATEPLLQALGGLSPSSTSSSSSSYARFASYTYTDISSAFFEKARARFGGAGAGAGSGAAAAAAAATRLTYRTLDMEREPEAQGFAAASYDLVLAANVLHATADIDATLARARRLLRPGGRLVLIEITRPRLRIALPFGTLPGWWLAGDETRSGSSSEGGGEGPLLDAKGWAAALRRNGFEGAAPDVCEADYPGPFEMSSLIVSRAAEQPLMLQREEGAEEKEEEKAKTRSVVRIHAPGNGASALSAKLEGLLEGVGHTLKPFCWAENDCEAGETLVVLDTDESGILDELDETRFSQLQRVLGDSSRGILWVTYGAIDSRPSAAMVSGLARTLRNEDAGLRIVTLDLDPETLIKTERASELILRVLDAQFGPQGRRSRSRDMELVERGGQLRVPRLEAHDELNEAVTRATMDKTKISDKPREPPRPEPMRQPGRPLRLQVGTPGLLDTLHFADVADRAPELDEDSVEFEVRAVGLNFRDVLTALGQIENPYPLGYDSAGVVTAVGARAAAAGRLRPGDRVAALAVGSFTSVQRARADHVLRLPDGLSLAEGASIPLAFATAYHALVDVARVGPGQTVLVHSAAGGVGQAAVKLAQRAGAAVIATAGSAAKRRLLRETYGLPASHVLSSRHAGFAARVLRLTGGRGVDAVLNSLAGELLSASWRCVAPFGHFLELGKRDVYANTRLEMRPFDRHVTFAAVDLSAVFQQRPAWGARLLADCFRLFETGELTPVTPVEVFPVDRVEAAFRHMQAGRHSGKIVVEVPADGAVVPVAPQPLPLSSLPHEDAEFLRADATYVIAGGAGGLGRAIARWMVDRGARHVLLLARRGAEGHEDALRQLQADTGGPGVVEVRRCDVRDAAAVAAELRRCGTGGTGEFELPPVRGIVNGAMVLRDALFERANAADWDVVTGTKILSTRALHAAATAAAASPLDFFVLLSSASGVSGNRGQAAYAAASAFQDAFARWCRRAAIAATVLDLGMIAGAGYAAERAGAADHLRRHGYAPIALPELFAMLCYAMTTARRDSDHGDDDDNDDENGDGGCQVVSGYDVTAAQHVAAALSPSSSSATGDGGVGLADPKFSHLPRIHLSSSSSSSSRPSDAAGQAAAVPLGQALRSMTTGGRAARAALLTSATAARLAGLLGRGGALLDTQRSSVAALGVDSLVAVELRNWLAAETGVSLPVFEILAARSLAELAGRVEAACAPQGEGEGEALPGGVFLSHELTILL